MTRTSLREYAAVQRERYQRAPRAEKHELLNEVVAVTGLHRKAAIRLLRRPPRPPSSRPRSGLSLPLTPSVSSALKFRPARSMMTGMITLILTGLLRVLRTRRALVLENLALRHQLILWQQHDLYGVANWIHRTPRADEKVWMHEAKIVPR